MLSIIRNTLRHSHSVVYAKNPFGGVHNVVKYLARYSHRVAISNSRIVNINETDVFFQWRDYKDNNTSKVMSLKGREFLRRFSMHIMPHRFRRIRHYGFLSNAAKKKRLTQARQHFYLNSFKPMSRQQVRSLAMDRLFGKGKHLCPHCGKGQMVVMEVFSDNKGPPVITSFLQINKFRLHVPTTS